MRTLSSHLAVLFVLATASACTNELADGLPDGDQCSTCHGSADNAAPPQAVVASDSDGLAVGAHQLHVREGFARKRLDCDSCHVMPAAVDSPGHIDDASPEHPADPADVVFGAFAQTAGAQPSWDRGAATCADSYCHGATLRGGQRTNPSWSTERPEYLTTLSVRTCQGCHGAPPPLPHPGREDCATCHPETVTSGLHILEDGQHLDGTVQAPSSCSACHGSEANPAPPADLSGNVATDALGVGAHQAHLGTSAWRRAITCDDCHLVPASLMDPQHVDAAGLPVELTWGALATARGTTAEWNRTSATCTNYCHGQPAKGGSVNAPLWTKVDGTQARCGACHGLPPPNHYGANCHQCHGEVVDPAMNIIAPERHIDGRVDASGACGACHGMAPATGAHAKHYQDTADPPLAAYGDLRVLETFLPAGGPAYMFGCGNCHPVDTARHLDGLVQIELFDATAPAGTVKALNPPTAQWSDGDGTCANVYCHSSGEFSPAYRVTPAWTSGTALGCASCHDNPPRYPSGGAGTQTANSHLQLGDDGWEFGHYAGLPGAWHEQPNRHGGGAGAGTGAAPITCQTCHSDTIDPANSGPSGFYYLDTSGDYVLPGGSANYRCASCHTGEAGSPPAGTGRVRPLRHVNGTRDVSFDARTALPAYDWGVTPAPTKPYWLTVTGGQVSNYDLATASYSADTKTCANVACHLNQTSVAWGVTPVGWASCNACHQY